MPTQINVGDVLVGKYRVDRVLGAGGMGMVLAAMHLDLERPVAIKIMLPEMMHSPQHVERFLREAKSAVKLRNEHVCRVLDVGKGDDGAPFIVMELLEGQDFSHVIAARGYMPVTEAVDYVLQAIEGIADAHANNIVHRDLKPENLFVTHTSDGAPLVKVLDFGISKSSAPGSATKTGDTMGSPSYMAPEQMLSAKDVDARADVWALGVILYKALTQRLPFAGDNLPELCMAVIHHQPERPIAYRPDLPYDLDAIIMGCLEKQLDQRVPNVAALARALVPFGSSTAGASADRVMKVLQRAGASGVGTASNPRFDVTEPSAPPASSSSSPNVASPIATSPRSSGISTLQASAGAISTTAPPRAPRRGLVAGIGALVVGSVITFAVIASRGSSQHDTAASSAPATPTSAPVAAPPQPPPPTPVVPASSPPAPPPPATAAAAAPATTGSASAEPPSVAPPPASPVSPATTRATGSTTKRATGAAVKKKTATSCDPPYTIDATGKRLYKPECL